MSAARDRLAAAIYGDGSHPDWLTTVDGSPNTASYELADRIIEAVPTLSVPEPPLVHGVNHWDDEIACRLPDWENPILVTGDMSKLTCQFCRAVLVSGNSQ